MHVFIFNTCFYRISHTRFGVFYIYIPSSGRTLITRTRPTALYCVMCAYKHNQRKAPEAWTSCRGSEYVELYLLDPTRLCGAILTIS